MSTILSQRVLPGLESHLGNAIIIVSNSTFDTDYMIHLSLIAPDLKGLDKLLARLGTWLKQSLTAVDPDWVHDVTIKPHFDNGESEIVVEITDASILGNASLDLVLAMAKTYVAPFAAQHPQGYRNVYVLKGEQRLVPLTFDQPVTSTAMSVMLPEPLSLRAPQRFAARQLTRDALQGADVSMDSSTAKCAYLTAALELAFDQIDWVDNIVVSSSAKGIHVAVNFDYRSPSPTPFTVNTTQNIIMEVLQRHVRFAGINNDLVFVSTTPAGDNDYDDGDDYSDTRHDEY